MAFCLTLSEKSKFKKALRNGEINISELFKMDESADRRDVLAKYVGKENAVQVNALLESKFFLKDVLAGVKRWIKKVSVEGSQLRKDLISRLADMKVFQGEKFYQDLATIKLKMQPTEEQAKTVIGLAKDIVILKAKADKDGVFANKSDEVAYGLTKVALKKYLGDMKLAAKRILFKEQPIQKILSMIGELPGIFKSSLTSLDNSFFGRQGIKTLYSNPKIWVKRFMESWRNIGKQIMAKGKWYTSGDDAVMDMIEAYIYSRPNAVNGKYEAGGYGLDVDSEEAYPSFAPEKIPLLGRLFKASAVAYNGGALLFRSDLADKFITLAEAQGVDTLNKNEAKYLGQAISSLTGRGSYGKYEILTKEANVLVFSVKFAKSNIDTLIAPIKYGAKKIGLGSFENKGEEFASKKSAEATLKIIGSIALLLFIAKMLDPDSVDEDPRSTNSGKIKIFGHWTDISGGLASYLSTALRLVPTMHNGKWGFWMKSSTGKWTSLTSGKYGVQTALDIFENFLEGKLAPLAGLVRDIWSGKNFQGQRVTIKNATSSLITPISIQNFNQLKDDPNSSSILVSTILDALGFSVSTYRKRKNK